ncbi:MAG: LacI family DNA-binding transcriptional regulator [Thermoanaerobaculia bacterium]
MPVLSRDVASERHGATIREVAREAAVSVATVSRVFTGKGPVRRATQQRIRRAAERLRYVPHGAARSLITRQTQTLGVLLPDLFGEFFSEIIRGVDTTARQAGYHLLVSGSHSDRKETEAMLRAMRGRVDGLIVLSSELDAETIESHLPHKLPVVLLGAGRHGGAVHTIDVDNYRGARAMTRHLLSLGHRRIAFVTGPPSNRDAAERLRGFRDAMRSAGDTVAGPEVAGDFREEGGYRAAGRILRGRSRPSAVFAANDSMAIGLLSGFREEGLRVPEDVALAGFDDIPIARFTTPALSTVHVPIAELGRSAARCLLEALEGKGNRATRETFAAKIVVRRSCGAPGEGSKGAGKQTGKRKRNGSEGASQFRRRKGR